MVELKSFRGLRYAGKTGEGLAELLAPPYDMISEKTNKMLRQKSPHNIVHVILPRSSAHAAKLLTEWEARHVLSRDVEPSFYILQQKVRWGKKIEERSGLIALVRIEPPETKKILPHEKTLSGPKRERLELLGATQANLDCVFGIFEDPQKQIQKILTRPSAGKRVMRADAPDGSTCELIQIPPGRIQKQLMDAFRSRRLLIADGHHRYEAARLYQTSQQEGRLPFQDLGHDYVLMYLIGSRSPGLHLLPYHRMVGELSPQKIESTLPELSKYFTIEQIPFTPKTLSDARVKLKQKVDYLGMKHPVFGLAIAGRSELLLLQLRRSVQVASLSPDQASPPLKNLNVTILQYLVFQRILGLTQEHVFNQKNVGFFTDEDECFELLHKKKFQLLFLLPAIPIQTVFQIAKNGETMPQKSTNFYPKVPTGFVMRRMV